MAGSDQVKSKPQRLKEIVAVFHKYKVLQNLSKQTDPQAVRNAFEELGPTFIKIGQLLSVRTDLLTPDYIQAFKSLQDNVKSDDFSKVKLLLEQEWGLPLEVVFEKFQETAFASASIGQAHLATLKNGQQVVVKVQHPGIVADINVDLALFEKAVPLIRYVPESNVVDVKSVLAEVRRSLDDETDFTKEAAYAKRFYQLNNDWRQVKVPKVYEEYCTSRVLILEFMEGSSLRYLLDADPQQIAFRDISVKELKKELGMLLVESFMKQVFEDGFFHADPHPGNVFFRIEPLRGADTSPPFRNKERAGVFAGIDYRLKWQDPAPLPDYRLIYLDFGMMGELPDQLRSRLIDALLALYTQDSRQLGEAVLRLCKVEGPFDEERFYTELGVFLDRYYDLAIKDIDLQRVLGEIIQICHQNNLQMVHEITMLIKAFSTLEGVIEELDPELSLMEITQPYAQKYYLQQIDTTETAKRLGLDLLKSGKSLPKLPDRSLQALETFTRGKTHLTLSFKEQEHLLSRIEGMVNRLVIGLILAAVIIGSSLLVSAEPARGAAFADTLGIFGYAVSLAVILLILLRHLWRQWRKK